jgi:hypothetical protein
MFYKEQAQLLHKGQIKTLQIDMNFKHIYGTNEYEVIFASYNETIQLSKLLLNT